MNPKIEAESKRVSKEAADLMKKLNSLIDYWFALRELDGNPRLRALMNKCSKLDPESLNAIIRIVDKIDK